MTRAGSSITRLVAASLAALAVSLGLIQPHPTSADDAPNHSNPAEHWAFQRPVRPDPPIGLDKPHPIDQFIAAEHTRRKLAARPPADPATLLRRAYLDLIGLPPTRDELHAFLADPSPDAYERVVDRLLHSPHYGERWGRHWMDVWRYADWFGRRYVPDVWNSAPQIWRWRDWIVQSLNDDKGYNQMVREMLAADEIRPTDESAAVATGFLIRNWYALNPNQWMRDNVEHTSKAFLGMTFHCAHCHDHKYDPITQLDYFRLRAFFEPIAVRQDRVLGEADPGPFQEYQYSVLRKVQRLGLVRVFDKNQTAPTWFYTGGDERNRVTDRGSIAPGVPASLGGPELKIEPIHLPPDAYYPGMRGEMRQAVVAERRAALEQAQTELAATQTTGPPAELREALERAESEWAAAVDAATQAGQPAAIAGRQSLLVDATTGRRTMSNPLGIATELADGSTVAFRLMILTDNHVNFQLARDSAAGLTAAYVAFDKGRILSYAPGGFSEFEAGKYDPARGQSRFEVTLSLEAASDRALLRVVSMPDGAVLVDAAPVARNGWNPAGNPKQGIFLDVRSGTVAVFDDIEVRAPASAGNAGASPLYRCDFEPPVFADDQDAIGRGAWAASSFSQLPATSTVSAAACLTGLSELRQKLRGARRAVSRGELTVSGSQKKRDAAATALEAMQARVAAEQLKWVGVGAGADVYAAAARTASRLERQAALFAAESNSIAAERAAAEAEAKPADDPKRAAELQAAEKQRATARSALDAAQKNLADPGKATAYPTLSPIYPTQSTGRRAALADWIASDQNPLTARVAVNHIWLRHFHTPLVASVADFGQQGARPTHPQLLDWLAVEFMQSGWSMKHLHRLIVTSNTYRMSSDPGPDASSNEAIDPENSFLWRMNAGRLESELVRDAILFLAGRLDDRLGGPELENKDAFTSFRRTIYYSCQPEADGRSEFAAIFDAPDPNDCYRRTRSVMPQQALALTNSTLIHEQSGAAAAKIWSSVDATDPDRSGAFCSAAFESILGRAPTDAERDACRAFLDRQTELIRARAADTAEPLAREALVRVLLNHNDFLTIR